MTSPSIANLASMLAVTFEIRFQYLAPDAISLLARMASVAENFLWHYSRRICRSPISVPQLSCPNNIFAVCIALDKIIILPMHLLDQPRMLRIMPWQQWEKNYLGFRMPLSNDFQDPLAPFGYVCNILVGRFRMNIIGPDQNGK